ncbi:blastula protease 10 [Chrysochromulina tobinii]|uniref:Blastula protease 10 n=1 Tax=Chrysochromulina tobinii TaxID=1460289 RepID=A0A0M0K4U5_9EUKA|nr:blastula protease 10 [Chrysochromulina tobinii]|eukprot:KOO33886.1 blastula protease 10 [Chrysochromulina sp. CCMP291]
MRHAWSALLLACVCAAAEDTHYDVLGVKRDVSPATLKKAYYGLARSLHPDKVTDPVAKAEAELQFKRVADAYSILSDETTRKAYDYEISSPRHQQRDVEEKQRMRKQTAGQASPLDGVREVVSSLDELADLTEGKAGKLTRHVLIALHDTREAACVEQMRNINFPEPFIGMSQEWHGVKWSDIIVVARHNVGPSLASGRPSTVLSAYEKEVGPATRGTRGVRMPRCPTIIFQSRGERLGRGAAHGDSPSSDTAFYTWVFSFLQVPLTIRSEYPSKVRINWIHGSEVKELFVLAPQGSVERMVYLSHTLHAERIDRKGTHISDNTSLLIFRVTNRSEMGDCKSNRRYMHENCKRSCGLCGSCFDNATTCALWKANGECETNAAYMRTACAFSCGFCDGVAGGGTADADAAPCVDDLSDCLLWAASGECKSNEEYMGAHCRRACGKCGTGECEDDKDKKAHCALWASQGECIQNARFMSKTCRRSCGLCGDGASGEVATSSMCEDAHKRDGECGRWASAGNCETNKAWMHEHCKRSCGLCDCADLAPKGCIDWKIDQQCTRNRRFMVKHCFKSCGWCGKLEVDAGKDACYNEDIKCETWVKDAPEVACEDKLSTDCPVLARSNEACETGFMKENCALSCGRCGKRPAPSQRARGKEEL